LKLQTIEDERYNGVRLSFVRRAWRIT
jgi:hypothetical protein